MGMLYSDDELRSALDAARRRWDEALNRAQSLGQKEAPASGPAKEAGFDIAQVKAAYHRLGCEAAQRWGLLR
jgi:hypothetical protein